MAAKSGYEMVTDRIINQLKLDCFPRQIFNAAMPLEVFECFVRG